MTDCTPTLARQLAGSFMYPNSQTAVVLRSLANQVEAMTADRDSWANQVSDRIDDALKFAAERDALMNDAARYRWLRSRSPGSAYRIAGVIYSEGGEGVDATIDRAMKEPK